MVPDGPKTKHTGLGTAALFEPPSNFGLRRKDLNHLNYSGA